jgi:hypothetical protein
MFLKLVSKDIVRRHFRPQKEEQNSPILSAFERNLTITLTMSLLQKTNKVLSRIKGASLLGLFGWKCDKSALFCWEFSAIYCSI